jgi:casein kinase II subunit alpha
VRYSVKFKKINREVKILMALAGKQNTIKLLDIVKEGEVYCLVFEHINQTDYKTILDTIQPRDCKLYIYQILKGLHYAHSIGIMHRDIKPQNVIIDHHKKEVNLHPCSLRSLIGDWESSICQTRITM